MRGYHKIFLIILSFLCFLIFSPQCVFAQNIDDLKLEIYSKLDCCPCKESFYKCNCKEAKKMKVCIEALLETGISKDEIFYKIAKKFSLNTIIDKQTKAEVEKRLAKEVGKERPEIVIEPSSFNFGKVSKVQGKIQKTFQLLNKGAAKLIVTNINVSCPCVTASLKVDKDRSPNFSTAGAPSSWQMEIEPNKIGELDITLDLNHSTVKSEPLYREITIFSNDPIYPEVTISIEAEVVD